jgi:pilus assembly protein CpaF
MLSYPELLSLNILKQYISSLKTHHFPLNRLKTVITKARGVASYLSKDMTEDLLAIGDALEITLEPDLMIASLNAGTSALSSMPHSAFSRDIKSLGDYLLKDTSYPRSPSPRAEAGGFHEQGIDTRTPSSGSDVDTGPCCITKDALHRLKTRIHGKLIAKLNLSTENGKALPDSRNMRDSARKIINDLLATEDIALNRDERARLVEELLDEVLGLGCIENFLKDPEVTEIMVNGPETVFIEKKGKILLADAQFTSSAQLSTIIDRIVSPLGKRIDESSPLVDARLPDGSRVNVIIPPLSLGGPTLTIRKFSRNKLTAEDLVKADAANPSMMEFLKICVLLRKNIVISGGTGSGKTTLLNVISSFIPCRERILTIEDSAELRLSQDHVVRLESRRPSVEGTGEVSIRHLVINALRMRPDRIIIGECRAGETLDMLQAMNTGHDGSLTTIHSNSPRDALQRIGTMALMSGAELPEKSIREQIASAIHLIVQLSRLSDGSRKIVDIAEIRGLRGDAIELESIFTFEQTGIREGKVIGGFSATGITPSFANDISRYGIPYNPEIFSGAPPSGRLPNNVHGVPLCGTGGSFNNAPSRDFINHSSPDSAGGFQEQGIGGKSS